MAIEILDYIPQSSGACIATFSVRFPSWKGFTVTEFRHCRKDSREWVDLPQKFKKNEDGTWEKPTPKSYFPSQEDNDALKRAIMTEIDKLPNKPKTEHELPF